jgi:hypothetical protein
MLEQEIQEAEEERLRAEESAAYHEAMLEQEILGSRRRKAESRGECSI